jgi:hypothetical protein
MGEPLHSLVLCGGELHEIELEMYNHFLFKENFQMEESKE